MDESEFFSDIILDFVKDKDKFEGIDCLNTLLTNFFVAIVDGTSSDEQRAEPRPPWLIANSSAQI